jgi:hypothetical protein
VIEIILLENGMCRLSAHYTAEDEMPMHSVPEFLVPGIEDFEWKTVVTMQGQKFFVHFTLAV